MTKLYYTLISLALMVAVWLFWWQGYPQLMSYQEQYQLFMSTPQYLWSHLGELGGFADYLGEFVVQYGTTPWLGALLIALTLSLMQILLALCLLHGGRGGRLSVAVYALAAIPSLVILRAMGDENLLMSYPVAVVISLALVLLTLNVGVRRWWAMMPIYAAGLLVSYWWAGGVAVLYAVMVPVLLPQMPRRWLWALAGVVAIVAAAWVLSRTLYIQYPESRLILGLNYYRVPNLYPAVVYAVPVIIIVLALCMRLNLAAWSAQRRRLSAAVCCLTVAAVGVAGLFFVDAGYDRDKMALLRYDYLVRGERWYDIIEMAEAQPPVDDFALQAVNLALAKTGQLGDRMFGFSQRGISSLIEPTRLDNTSCLITAEVFWHLGMINSAFRYSFDTQEAIMNDRKSGRLLKRMAQCMIANGKYKIASKYLAMLQKSPVYGPWAREKAALIADEAQVAADPLYADKRRVRYADEMLYDYNEIDKMLGILALKSQGGNMLAWDYFNAAMLLKGDLTTFTGMYHYARELFGLQQMPRYHQEAMAMYWTFGHQTFDGIPYPISDEVKQLTARLATCVMRSPQNPQAWEQQCGGCYGVYYLRHAMPQASASDASAPDVSAKGAERGD